MASSSGWRGWWFWWVTVIGERDPVEVARRWTLADVTDAAVDLMVRSVLESVE